jgi:hypothetical protein
MQGTIHAWVDTGNNRSDQLSRSFQYDDCL